MFDKPFSKPRKKGVSTPPSTRSSSPSTLLLLSVRYGRFSKEELESARRTARRRLKRQGRLLLRIASFLPVTSKPSQVRMGKGKGKISGYLSPVEPGQVVFELSGVPFLKGFDALQAASNKLSVSTVIRPMLEIYS